VRRSGGRPDDGRAGGVVALVIRTITCDIFRTDSRPPLFERIPAMRKFTSALVATLILGASASPVLAVEAKAPAAAPAPDAAKARHYTTADTEIGTLLDDPEAKAIIAKNIT